MKLIPSQDTSYPRDGGLYAKLIRNRAFQGSGNIVTPTNIDWQPIVLSEMQAFLLTPIPNPLSSALPNVMKILQCLRTPLK